MYCGLARCVVDEVRRHTAGWVGWCAGARVFTRGSPTPAHSLPPLPAQVIDPTYMIRAVPTTSNDRVYCKVLGQGAVHGAFAGAGSKHEATLVEALRGLCGVRGLCAGRGALSPCLLAGGWVNAHQMCKGATATQCVCCSSLVSCLKVGRGGQGKG